MNVNQNAPGANPGKSLFRKQKPARIAGGISLALLTLVWLAGPTTAAERSLILQSTTSTANSGLYDHLLPLFRQQAGITVHVVAVGTGQAVRNAMSGDGDVLLVHAKSTEEQFVADGYGVERFDVMYNDFVFVGPPADPADLAVADNAVDALSRIATSGALFTSRGDDSGTHKKELSLWRLAGINPSTASGTWYRETGSGMGATLNVAVGMGAYTMADRATWISFANKGEFRILFEDDSALFNQYGIILVNPARHSHVKAEAGQIFIDWITGIQGQQAIAAYELGGRQLFFPNAR